MLIQPKSNTLISDIDVIFDTHTLNLGYPIQERKGRYVINSQYGIAEVLVLNDDNNVIDGFCLYPVFILPWKSKPFVWHLAKLNNIKLNDIFVDSYEEIDYNQDDYFDEQMWNYKGD